MGHIAVECPNTSKGKGGPKLKARALRVGLVANGDAHGGRAPRTSVHSPEEKRGLTRAAQTAKHRAPVRLTMRPSIGNKLTLMSSNPVMRILDPH